MVLNGNDIRKLIEEKRIVENADENYISSGSIDVSMSSKILKIKRNKKCIDLRDSDSINDMYEEIEIKDGYKLKPNEVISNSSPNTYLLTPNTRIGQIVFETLSEGITNDLLYGNKYDNAYQNEEGNTGSKIYQDYVGKVFRHFKGNYYFIENISTDSETKEEMIIYRPLYERKDSMLWCRPAKMFFEEIDANRKGNITHQIHRFELVEDLTKNYINDSK